MKRLLILTLCLTLLTGSLTIIAAPPTYAAISPARQRAIERRKQRLAKIRQQLHSSSSSSAASVQSSVPAVLPETSLKRILDLVNAERKLHGLGELRRVPALDTAAQAQAEDMLKRNFFAHINPDGKTPTDRIKQAGYIIVPASCGCQITGYATGENIAKAALAADAVFKLWMNSPEHRDNILSGKFTDIGLGLAGDEWVQDFGNLTVSK